MQGGVRELPHRTVCGNLVLQPGMEAVLPAVEAQSLNHWTSREVLKNHTFILREIFLYKVYVISIFKQNLLFLVTETLFRQYILIRITCILDLLFSVWCGFPSGSVGKVCLQCGSPGFNPWAGKIPQRRKWQPTPAFLPGEFHGQRSLVGYSSWGRKEWDTTEWLALSLSLWCGGLPWWLSGEEPTCQCRSCRFSPWVRRIPWRREWQPTTWRIPWTEEPGGSPWARKKSDTTERLNTQPTHVTCWKELGFGVRQTQLWMFFILLTLWLSRQVQFLHPNWANGVLYYITWDCVITYTST